MRLKIIINCIDSWFCYRLQMELKEKKKIIENKKTNNCLIMMIIEKKNWMITLIKKGENKNNFKEKRWKQFYLRNEKNNNKRSFYFLCYISTDSTAIPKWLWILTRKHYSLNSALESWMMRICVHEEVKEWCNDNRFFFSWKNFWLKSL